MLTVSLTGEFFMKLSMVELFFVAVFSLSSSIAFSQTPIVKKVNMTGFSLPEEVFTETCTLYDDHVLITRSYGENMAITERRELRLTGSMIDLLTKVKNENMLIEENNVCDGPHTEITAYLPSQDGAASSMTLFKTGGCSAPQETRDGSYSLQLRRMVASYCPKTHKRIEM
jgi:hypothetical protein